MSTSLQCVLRSDVARLYRRISKRLAVETTSLYCSCFITPSHHSCSLAWPDPRRKREGLAMPDYRSCSSLLKSTHAISIDFAEMHADHIVSSGSPHNNVLHFSSYEYSRHSRQTRIQIKAVTWQWRMRILDNEMSRQDYTKFSKCTSNKENGTMYREAPRPLTQG